jgi:hypothetical protein
VIRFRIGLSQQFEQNTMVFLFWHVYAAWQSPTHTACCTMKQIQDLRFVVLPHSPYAPGIAPSDFHLL